MCTLKRNEILLLFDVDGTLTYPRSVINDDFERFLYGEIQPKAKIGIVGGADLQKMFEQLNGEKILQKFDLVFPENGLVQYDNGVECGKQSLQKHLGEEILQNFINYVLRYISKLQLPFKRGTFLEFRNGMMNICPCGRNCSRLEREIFANYDQMHHIREKMINCLREEFKNIDLTYSIGGEISFDVFPNGWDKTYCLKYITEHYNFKEIHFFGDRIEKGGNDYEIYTHPLVIGHKVKTPEDTRKILTELFNIRS